MFSFWIKVLVGLTLVAVAACGKLPRPFEPGAKDPNNPLLTLQDSPGVVVAPIYDAPPELAAPLADGLAEFLRAQDVPATAADILNSGNLLEGWYLQTDTPAGHTTVVIEWRLSDKTGAELLALESRVGMPTAALAKDPQPLIKRMTANVAPKVADAMIGEQTAQIDASAPSLAIGDITGAPGDGNAALRRAFSAVLHRTEITITKSPEGAMATLDSIVQVTPHSEKEDEVRLVWTIRDSEQKTVAVLKQDNRVRKGRLAHRWGSMAFDVALALRRQIVETMRRLGNSSSGGLALPPALK
ncbi:MAG: hypothetical protein CMM69_09090 [Rhodospirillaceae bacterium]|nr:hypothetical protein [Rhodospirillaceae bacterium]OUX26677.1 MAG: hypothetical protein CBE16_09620 [Rhodospirillaceae bacterium TMED256]